MFYSVIVLIINTQMHNHHVYISTCDFVWFNFNSNLPTSLTSAYRRSYGQLIQSLHRHVSEMGSYPLRENYSALVKKSMSNSIMAMQKSINSLTAMTQQVEATLVKYKENTKQFANSLTSEWNIFN